MYTEIFTQLGLVKNEARIYEALLKEGESSVGRISVKSGVHRRNVYDTLNRLMEKGLVAEIVDTRENRYQAVDPQKLMEILEEKKSTLDKVMPSLKKLYKDKPHQESVQIYHGPEGWKNYMLDMINTGETVYFIAAKGGWLDERVKDFFPTFIEKAEKAGLDYYHIFDHEVQTDCQEILKYVGDKYKFLPKGYSTRCSIDIFGDHVNIVVGIKAGSLEEESSLVVIKNPLVADSFRTWFQFMWDVCPDN